MILELLVLFYLLLVVLAIMLTHEYMNITLQDFKYTGFYLVIFTCFVPSFNFIAIGYFLELIEKEE